MQLEATNRTPAVSISATGIEMKGECYPEDITAFAEPVMEALRQQLESAENFHVRIELYYFNSSSAKFLFDFFEELSTSFIDIPLFKKASSLILLSSINELNFIEEKICFEGKKVILVPFFFVFPICFKGFRDFRDFKDFCENLSYISSCVDI